MKEYSKVNPNGLKYLKVDIEDEHLLDYLREKRDEQLWEVWKDDLPIDKKQSHSDEIIYLNCLINHIKEIKVKRFV